MAGRLNRGRVRNLVRRLACSQQPTLRGETSPEVQPRSRTACLNRDDEGLWEGVRSGRSAVVPRHSGTQAAIGSGQLIPLNASGDSVAAYLRRDDDRTVLVVANLAKVPLSGVRISCQDRVLPSRRSAPTSLLGAPQAASLRIGSDGLIRGFVSLSSLAATQAYVFELSKAP